MQGHVLRHKSGPQFAGGKGVDLFIDRADLGALGIIQHRQADRAGQVIFGELRW